jgi:hypothetical protein
MVETGPQPLAISRNWAWGMSRIVTARHLGYPAFAGKRNRSSSVLERTCADKPGLLGKRRQAALQMRCVISEGADLLPLSLPRIRRR